MYPTHNFELPSLGALYDHSRTDPRFIEWRRIGARDKANNIIHSLGADRDVVDTVLEVGCGTGTVLEQLVAAGIGRQYTGIEVGEFRPSKLSGGGEISGYDGKTIPFPDESFDFVYATHVLEHVLDERGFLAELVRVSRELVYIEVPCEIHLRTSFRSLQSSLTGSGHVNAYIPETFALTLETAGLRIIRFGLFDHDIAVYRFQASPIEAQLKRLLRQTLLRISPTLAARLFTYHCGALCRKGQPLVLAERREHLC